jgi:diguanylate cyclase (GGDEF)-like protein
MEPAEGRDLAYPPVRAEDNPFRTILAYGSWTALAVHALFGMFFYAIGVPVLVYFNIGSVALYFGCAVFVKRRIMLALLLVSAEVVAHSWLAVAAVGLTSGFQYYLFAVAPLAFFNHGWRKPAKIAHLLLVFCAYVALVTWYDQHGAWVAADRRVLEFLQVFNAGCTFAFLAFIAHHYVKLERLAEARLRHLAITDALTGLHNRRHILRIADHELARHRRSHKPIAIVILDIDDFKSVNDRFGHECGDDVLKAAADRMRAAVRAQDQVARWGGEEFVLLLPETDLDGARDVAEKVRHAISDTPIQHGADRVSIRITAGVCAFEPGEDLDRVLARADRALLEGKRAGKDRVVVVSR